MNDLQSIVIYFWAYDDFLKLKNCGQKCNLELIEFCRKYELTLRKSIVVLFGENPSKSFIQKINDYSIKQKSLFNNNCLSLSVMLEILSLFYDKSRKIS